MQPGDETPTEALLVDRYQLGECIGEGGMARVHRGFDHALGRPVAIKVMRSGVEDAAGLVRARAEMTVLASLSHPSLVTLYDARIVPGQVSYLVMELVEGPTLSAWLEGGAVDERDVAHLALDLAEALHVVHTAGVVHRDVKPSNVLLSRTDLPGRTYRARLADFGIAYLVDSTRLTTPGLVVGTAAYLAPEQVRGAAPAPPADVYALGLLLLEAITGERAFAHASGVESLVTRLHAAPTVPDSIAPEWQELLRAMTAMDPSERPTALEVATAASALLMRPPAPVRPVPERVDTMLLPAPLLPAPELTAPELTVPVLTAPVLTAAMRPEPVTDAASPEGAVSPTPRSRIRSRRRPRPRRGLMVGATLVAACAVVAATWFATGGGAVPSPISSVVAVTEPSVAPSTDPATNDSPETVTAETDDTSPVVTPVDAVSPGDAPVTDPVDPAPVQVAEIAPVPGAGGTQGSDAVAPESPDASTDKQAQKAAENAQKAAEREAEKIAASTEKAAEKAAKAQQ